MKRRTENNDVYPFAGATNPRQTPPQHLGPYFPVANAPLSSGDLTAAAGSGSPVQGEIIEVRGRVVTLQNMPVMGARLLIWQANSFGRYAHPNDSNPAPLDPNFTGFAEVHSDHEGAYHIRTVKPGAYPTRSGRLRPPHIHFEVHGKFERLITQMYFPGDPLKACDPVLLSANHRDLLVAKLSPLQDGHSVFRFDLVLARG